MPRDCPPTGFPSERTRVEDPRRRLGRRGEELALEHLQARGLGLLARNHRTRHGEIDLIVSDGHTLVFVEVKTRRSREAPGSVGRTNRATPRPEAPLPLEGLGQRQRERLRRLAYAWLRETALRPRPLELRFDAIGVIIAQNGALVRLDHVEGAW